MLDATDGFGNCTVMHSHSTDGFGNCIVMCSLSILIHLLQVLLPTAIPTLVEVLVVSIWIILAAVEVNPD